jgi:hypothetical protein
MWVVMWIAEVFQLGYSSILIGFPFGVLLVFLANMCFEPPSQQPLVLYGTTTDDWSDGKYMTHQVV